MVVAKDLLKWKEFVAEMLGMKTFPLRVMRFSCSKTLKKCSAKISITDSNCDHYESLNPWTRADRSRNEIKLPTSGTFILTLVGKAASVSLATSEVSWSKY